MNPRSVTNVYDLGQINLVSVLVFSVVKNKIKVMMLRRLFAQ